MKTCKVCNNEKPKAEFYKSNKVKDGFENKCISCRLKRMDELILLKKQNNPNWHEEEKERHRLKYYRLGYKDKYKATSEQRKQSNKNYTSLYPEKKYANSMVRSVKPIIKGNQLHHWSYRVEDAKDVIELSVKDHNTAHRFLVYDQERMMYRTTYGLLLDTKELHLNYINKHIGDNL